MNVIMMYLCYSVVNIFIREKYCIYLQITVKKKHGERTND